MLSMISRFMFDSRGIEYVQVRQIPADESVRRRNENLAARAREYLGDRHILVRQIDRRGDWWRTRTSNWRAFDDRR